MTQFYPSWHFLGPSGANLDLFKSLFDDVLKEHRRWRRHFHPEDISKPPPADMPPLKNFKRELRNLTRQLGKSVPFFSPRYMGHMVDDPLLPGLLGSMAAMFYNPNNISHDAGPATVEMEVEVGFQLARMLGFATWPEKPEGGWGHLTSGGTTANLQALRNLMAVKCFPPALARTLRQFPIELRMDLDGRNLLDYTSWELFNFSLDDAIQLHRGFKDMVAAQSQDLAQALSTTLKRESISYLGLTEYLERHPGLHRPVLIVGASAHYSWRKAAALLGLGEKALIFVESDANHRMDPDHLDRTMAECHMRQRPVLATIAVLGSTEFGGIDPIHHLVSLRRQWARKGLHGGLHVDAAWGGYLAALFREEDGRFAPPETLGHFPSSETCAAFRNIPQTDSVTIDPHKLGFQPFPCGAYICRDSGVIDFIGQNPAYVFDGDDQVQDEDSVSKLLNLGQYTLEGSKPGAPAAGLWFSNRLLPLHRKGLGRLVASGLKATAYLHRKLMELKHKHAGQVRISIPFVPDANILSFALNPCGNRDIAKMNRFTRRVYQSMRPDPNQDTQTTGYLASSTALHPFSIHPEREGHVLDSLGLDWPCKSPRGLGSATSLFLIRHVLMNPGLLNEKNGVNEIDRYLTFLETRIQEALDVEQQPRMLATG